jgi:hypothetical protein
MMRRQKLVSRVSLEVEMQGVEIDLLPQGLHVTSPLEIILTILS